MRISLPYQPEKDINNVVLFVAVSTIRWKSVHAVLVIAVEGNTKIASSYNI